MSEVRSPFRAVPTDLGETAHALPEASLQRQGQAPAWYWRGFTIQGIGFLHHRLPQPRLQGSGEEGLAELDPGQDRVEDRVQVGEQAGIHHEENCIEGLIAQE